MSFLGTTFIVPGVMGIVGFCVWLMVISRATNLECPRLWRYLAWAWITSLLLMSSYDLTRTHLFESEAAAASAVIERCIVWSGIIGIGLAVYKLLALAFPNRMEGCSKEPSGCAVRLRHAEPVTWCDRP